jgi:hypothetical protein
MAKVCVKLTAAPEVGQFIPGVGTVMGIAGGPFDDAECSKACCNTGQCVSKQFRFITNEGFLSTPGATLCTAALLPSPPDVTEYFYGSDAEFAASVPPQWSCPVPLPSDWTCCVSIANSRSATGCDIRYVWVNSTTNTGYGSVTQWRIDKTWDMGEI